MSGLTKPSDLQQLANFVKKSSLRITSTKGAGVRLVRLRQADHSWAMAALLSPVQDGKIWRVQIVWPNGHVHHFGKFISKRDAIDWINAHLNLTKSEDTRD